MVIASGAIRMEERAKSMPPSNIRQLRTSRVTNAPDPGSKETGRITTQAWYNAKKLSMGSIRQRPKPVGYELMNKWDAWVKCGCLASEMESQPFISWATRLRVRVGTALLVMANQERAKKNLPQSGGT